MYSTLINLFNENLDLTKRQLLDFPLREHYQQEHDKLQKQLDGVLNKDGQKLLDALLEANTHEKQYYSYESFICGFRLASLLMIEVFHDKDNMLENKEQYLRHFNHQYKGMPSVMDDLT